jgi:drug/metabolite transporter (DMT)-like permease
MKAILLNISAFLLLPIMDGIAKHLSTEIHFIQVVWGRYFFMALISFFITCIFFNKNLKWPNNFNIQISRSLFLLISTILFFFAISIISLTEAITLHFVSPIIVTFLSAFLLKEKVGIRRWIAVGLGFLGAVIVIRPGFEEFNIASLAAFGSGISYGFYIIGNRKVSNTDSPSITLIFTGISGAILLSFIVPYYWSWLNINQWYLLILLASVGSFAHLLMIISFKYAEASKLAPFAYFEIITNVMIGYIYFNDFPDKWIWIGLFFIALSGVYISLRENVKKNMIIK